MNRPTVIKIAAWGEKFVRAAADNVFACLLSPGQLDDPGLRAEGEVIVHVIVPPADRHMLEAADTLRRLRDVATVELTWPGDEMPSPGNTGNLAQRRRLALAEHHSLLFARRLGADWIPLNADALISNRFVPAVKARLTAGRRAVAGSPVRTERESFEAEIGTRRNFTAAELYALSLRHMHRVMFDYFLRDPPSAIPAAPHMALFATADGFAAHSVQLSPYGIDTRYIPESYPFDGLTLDCRMLADLLRDSDRDAACWIEREVPGEAYMTALDDAAGIASFGSLKTTTAQVARSARHFMRYRHDIDHFRWAVAQRVFYSVPGELRARLPTDCIDEAAAVAAIVNRLRLGLRRALSLRVEEFSSRCRPGRLVVPGGQHL